MEVNILLMVGYWMLSAAGSGIGARVEAKESCCKASSRLDVDVVVSDCLTRSSDGGTRQSLTTTARRRKLCIAAEPAAASHTLPCLSAPCPLLGPRPRVQTESILSNDVFTIVDLDLPQTLNQSGHESSFARSLAKEPRPPSSLAHPSCPSSI